MLEETYKDCLLEALPRSTEDGRFSVAVRITRGSGPEKRSEVFVARDGISYALQIEAEKECLNLGRRLASAKISRPAKKN